MTYIAFRHAAYDSPWWVNSNTRDGRFHRALEHPTQYWALHPLGPAAELLRHHLGPDGVEDAGTAKLNLWVARIDSEGILQIGFDNCEEFGIAPEELVGDDYEATQGLADRLRADGALGLRVPSAALPGTDNLILFGVRVLHPYLIPPFNEEEICTGHVTDDAFPAAEVVPLVRWFGEPHPALDEWRATGAYDPLDDPAPFAGEVGRGSSDG